VSAKRRELEYFTQHAGRQMSCRKDRARAKGYSAQDGDWNDAGTFESLLRVGMIVNKHREKKEGTTDKQPNKKERLLALPLLRTERATFTALRSSLP
jgi:dTDP-glucose pyrophosphorylase